MTSTATMSTVTDTMQSRPLEQDLLSFDNWDAPAAAPVVPVSFGVEKEQDQSFDGQGALRSEESNTVKVLVSGSHFFVDQQVFHQLKALPWEKKNGTHTLHGNSQLFEVVLNNLLFKTLPDTKTLSPHDKEELGNMASLLNLNELAGHLMTRSSFRQRRRTSSVTSIPEEPKEENNQNEESKNDSKEDPANHDNTSKSSDLSQQQHVKITKSQSATFSDESSSENNSLVDDEDEKKQEDETNQSEKKDEKSRKSAMSNTVRQGFRNSFRRALSFPGKSKNNDNNSSRSLNKADKKKNSKNNNKETSAPPNKENNNNSTGSRLKLLKKHSSVGGSDRSLSHVEWCASHSDIIF